MQLETFEEDAKQLACQASLTHTKDARKKVEQVSDDNPTGKDVEECTTLSANSKEEIDQLQTMHDNFKAQLNVTAISS